MNVEENCFISANTLEFKQLIINIIKNAIEVSNNGDPVIVNVCKKDNVIEIQVIDLGIGMSEEEVKSLGMPFYSLKSKGTGLGLMVSFKIIEKYNGSIHFKSARGEGTTVTIRFPAVGKTN